MEPAGFPITPSFRAALRVPGMARIAVSMLLGRWASRMWTLALVLFSLNVFHSPPLAGVTVACSIVPGLLVSPLAGALLDRHGRAVLVVLDYLLGGCILILLTVLALIGWLSPPLLLLLVGVTSLTTPLSTTGVRSLLPTILPRELWDHANGIDSATQELASVLGPAVAGLLIGMLGSTLSLGAIALIDFAAAISLMGINWGEAAAPRQTSAWRDALAGLRYVLRENRTLRGLATILSVANLAGGALIVAIPLIVEQTLGGSAALVGILLGLSGISAIVSALVVARIGTEGRENQALAVGIILQGFSVLLLAFSHSYFLIAVVMILFGLGNGPIDIGLFSLRQRRTDRAWFGRAFAVSMSLNFSGFPLGSAIAGIALPVSRPVTLLVAAVIAFGAAALIPRMIPKER